MQKDIICCYHLQLLTIQVAANFRVTIVSTWLRSSQHTTPNGVISQQLRDVPSFRMTKIPVPPTGNRPKRPLSSALCQASSHSASRRTSVSNPSWALQMPSPLRLMAGTMIEINADEVVSRIILTRNIRGVTNKALALLLSLNSLVELNGVLRRGHKGRRRGGDRSASGSRSSHVGRAGSRDCRGRSRPGKRNYRGGRPSGSCHRRARSSYSGRPGGGSHRSANGGGSFHVGRAGRHRYRGGDSPGGGSRRGGNRPGSGNHWGGDRPGSGSCQACRGGRGINRALGRGRGCSCLLGCKNRDPTRVGRPHGYLGSRRRSHNCRSRRSGDGSRGGNCLGRRGLGNHRFVIVVNDLTAGGRLGTVEEFLNLASCCVSMFLQPGPTVFLVERILTTGSVGSGS